MEQGFPNISAGSISVDRKCPECHSRYSRSALLGCPTCYTEFREELIPEIRRIHGSTIHKGKVPVQKTNKETKRWSGKSPSPLASTDLDSRILAKAKWMQGDGPDCDVVISTRIRLARNISGHAFCNSAEKSELQHIAGTVENGLVNLCEYTNSPLCNVSISRLEHLEPIDREFLIERYLISRDLAEKNGTGKVIVDEEEIVSIMINEEDHIRLQVIDSGLRLRQSWEMINSIDDELEQEIDYAFSPDWGYLTACPTNIGTGLRVSVMLHIPALAATKEGKQILLSISDMGYAVRGIYGEGSQATGAFFQISNEATLGRSEEEIVDRIRWVARQIVDREREERRILMEESGIGAEDRIYRSYGTLMNARLISSREALNLLSWVSLGSSIGVLPESSRTDITRLLVLTRPAHLQKCKGKKLNSVDRDISRAAAIREILRSNEQRVVNNK
jgi:protein arginine kinase